MHTPTLVSFIRVNQVCKSAIISRTAGLYEDTYVTRAVNLMFFVWNNAIILLFDTSAESMSFLHESRFVNPSRRRGSTIEKSGNNNSARAFNEVF